jgi:pyrroline-5-carboxylate reductase
MKDLNMLEQVRFAFIGGGNMAEALIKGLLSGLGVKPQHIIATDVLPERRSYMQATYGITASAENKYAVQESEVIVLAVKPQIMPSILEEIAPVVNSEKVVISIAAGITLQTLQRALGDSRRVVRVMPNTPALVLGGAAGISPGKAATAQDIALVERIFNAVGGRCGDDPDGRGDGSEWEWSGVRFALIEGLSDGGVLMGLARPTATMLAAQTVRRGANGLGDGDILASERYGDVTRGHDYRWDAGARKWRFARSDDGSRAPGHGTFRSARPELRALTPSLSRSRG